MGTKTQLPPPAEETLQPSLTADTVAHDFFQEELNIHQSGVGVPQRAQMVVILQDDCYGHRFARPRTSRANLSTIVERPERIHACILGLASAYVRLGRRHGDSDTGPHPKRRPSSFTSVPFKIHKTARRLSLKSPAATAIHGTKWMSELSIMCDAAESKLATNGKELTRPATAGPTDHDAHAERPKLHEGDLYLCSDSLNALEGALGGVCEGVDVVFNEVGPKRAFVCIRPPGHHCSADMPSGFCWLNNVHVGIGHAVLNHGLTHAAIIDFDLHHGDGSQSITWAHNSRLNSLPRNTSISKKPAIGYFSMHDINSYPCEMGDDEKVRNASLCIENAHGQTVWNVHLQPWKTEAEFWKLYEEQYSVVLAKARNFLLIHSDRLRLAPTHLKPKAAIFLSSGFDASEWESPGMQRHHVNVPTTFYARLTQDVTTLAAEEGLGVDGRVISVLEGGYSDRALMSGVLSHVCGLATDILPPSPTDPDSGLGREMGRKLGKLDINETPAFARGGAAVDISQTTYNSNWWSLAHLEELENAINPPAPVSPPKKQRNDSKPTYTSNTQSFTAKIVSPSQARRSLSGSSQTAYPTASPISRTSSPPPPVVDWFIAAHELSKILVPTDRETGSCKPEDLNAEASRKRRDRYSAIGVHQADPATIVDSKRMNLREKKPKTPQNVPNEEKPKAMARTNRRKTIADVTTVAEESGPLPVVSSNFGEAPPSVQVRRRSSVASTASSATTARESDYGAPFKPASTTELPRNSLAEKKARAPLSSRPDAPKPKAVRKPPLSRGSSSSSGAFPSKNDGEVALPLRVNEDLTNKDVDQLSSGMKKMSLKLNVPPKDEYDSRKSKPKAAPRGKSPRVPASKTMKPGSPTEIKAKPAKSVTVSKSKPVELPLLQQGPSAPVSDIPRDLQLSVPQSMPILPGPVVPAMEKGHSHQPTSFTSQEPKELAYKSSAQSSEVPPYLTPQNDKEMIETPKPPTLAADLEQTTRPETPVTAKRARQDLPVFTSTSPIAFGKPSPTFPDISHTMYQNGFAPPASNLPGPAITEAPANSGATEREFQESDVKVEVKGTSTSIWDVPDTPQAKKP